MSMKVVVSLLQRLSNVNPSPKTLDLMGFRVEGFGNVLGTSPYIRMFTP